MYILERVKEWFFRYHCARRKTH